MILLGLVVGLPLIWWGMWGGGPMLFTYLGIFAISVGIALKDE